MQFKLSAFLILLLAYIEMSKCQNTESPQSKLESCYSYTRCFDSEKFQKLGNKSYYIEEQYRVNWFRAVHRCHEIGAHLANLQNEDEFLLLKPYLNVNRSYWIDVNDLGNEGEYLSLTTGTGAPYVNWYPRYNPDNKGGNENCVNLWTKNRTLGMNDARCTSISYFVCELW